MKLRKIIAILLMVAVLKSVSITALAVEDNNTTPSGIPFSELENRLDAVIGQYLGTVAPGIAVVITYEDEIVFSQGWGYRDSTARIPIDPATTVFEYASISKLFIWVAAMQLVEQGLLDLDADIAVYLPPEFMNQINLDYPITMRHLMDHTAGFEFPPFYSGELDATTITEAGSLHDALIRIRPRQIFTPGAVSAYSNFGTSLAAYIVSHIAAQGYADFELENIFLPAGMTTTLNQPHWVGNDAFLANKALGYLPNILNPGTFSGTLWSYVPDYPSGAVNGTAEDLARFAIALTPPAGESGVLFESAATLSQMFSPSSLNPAERPGTYHGFMRYRSATNVFGHAGGVGGFTTDFAVAPEERFGVVVLSNAGAAFELTLSVMSLLLGEPETAERAIPSNLPDANTVEGMFVMGRAKQSDDNLLAFWQNAIPAFAHSVTAIDENTIELNTALFGSAIYRQVEPYVFEITLEDELPVMHFLLHTLSFDMYDGTPVQIRAGSGMDFIYADEVDVIASLMILVLGVICILFFLILPIVFFIGFLVNRKKEIEKTDFRKFSRFFIYASSLLSLHAVIIFVRFISGFLGGTLSRSGMMPHIWITYLLTALTVGLFVLAMYHRRKEKATLRRRTKVFFAITWNIWLVILFAMFDWNFFVLL